MNPTVATLEIVAFLKEVAEICNAVDFKTDLSEFGNSARFYFPTEEAREQALAWLPDSVSVGGQQKGNYYTLNVTF